MKIYKGSIRLLKKFVGNVNKRITEINFLVSTDKKAPTGKIKQFAPYVGSLYKRIDFGAVIRPLYSIYRFLRSVRNRIVSSHSANAIAAPATEMDLDNQITVESDAPLTARPAEELKTKIGLKSSVVSKMVARRLAILRYIKGILFNPISRLSTAFGAVARYKKKIPHRAKFLTTYAPAAETKSRFNTIKHTHESTANSAPAQIAGVETSFTATHSASANAVGAISADFDSALKVNHSAKIAVWRYPVVTDGVMYLRQVYSATVENDVLEVR